MEKKVDLLQYIESEIIDFFPKVFVVNSFDPNIQEYASKMFRFKSASGNKISIWLFNRCLIIELPAKSPLAFSINIPDIVCMINNFMLGIQYIGQVYTRGGDNDAVYQCIDLLQNELKSLKFENNEGIIVYKNSLKLVLKGNRKLNHVIKTLEIIKNKIEQPDFKEATIIQESEMPEKFRKILRDFSEWIIFDDLERQMKIDETNNKQIKQIINSISPYLPEINKYLDDFQTEPLPDRVAELQNLAELVSELMINRK